MKAMLVTVEITTRVVVADQTDEADIIESARGAIELKISHELHENITLVEEDKEYPFDPGELG